jgi:NAD(P)-dependent dehydrogenase (short-subunit alcohol dehydrogenase family)
VLSWLARPGAYAASKTAFWGLTNALRLELAEQKTQVLGAHLGYADTPLIAHLTDVAKGDPGVIVGRILDALEDGQDEAIADDVSAQVKSVLSGITTGVIPQ